jgi:tRNA-2-methylthio-N6-dimethylallyladenosine synthase
MKFFIKTYGCQMNVNDSEKMRYILEEDGFIYSDTEHGADIIIINSCAVREKPQDKIFSYAGRIPGKKIIIVAGCVAQSQRDKILKRNHRINAIVGTHQFYQINQIIRKILERETHLLQTEFSKKWQESIPEPEARVSDISGYISIMEGCNNFCSYCIVPFTRGREKYRLFEQIVEEAEYLDFKGYKEIILLGQNVNSWRDLSRKKTFIHLLDYLASKLKDVKWIRFITSYPGYHDNELIEVMAQHRKIARNIHFPAQSGSTRILKKMNRVYSRSQYLNIIKKFKQKVPGISFSSDFIVGYPGETEHDFNLTLSLVEDVEYENIFSFVFSPRQHTKAAGLRDNLSLEIKKDRLYQLQETQKRIQLKNNKKERGKIVEVLVTGKNPKKPGEVIGRTESYRVVNFRSTTSIGRFTRVLIDEVGPYSLRGREKGHQV